MNEEKAVAVCISGQVLRLFLPLVTLPSTRGISLPGCILPVSEPCIVRASPLCLRFGFILQSQRHMPCVFQSLALFRNILPPPPPFPHSISANAPQQARVCLHRHHSSSPTGPYQAIQDPPLTVSLQVRPQIYLAVRLPLPCCHLEELVVVRSVVLFKLRSGAEQVQGPLRCHLCDEGMFQTPPMINSRAEVTTQQTRVRSQ